MSRVRLPAILLSFLLCFILVFQVLPAGIPTAKAAGTWYVDGALGTDAVGYGTGSGVNAFRTITYAVTSATSGDTISVAAGTYGVSTGEVFPITIDRQVTLLGAQANVDPRPSHGGRTGAETIIDGGGTATRVLQISASGVELNGFTVAGGTAGEDIVRGDGLASAQVEGLLLRYNIIYSANQGDEGIQLVFTDSAVIEYNYAHNLFGDAFNICRSSNGVIRYNEAHDLVTRDAGVYCYLTTDTDIIGNLVYNVDYGDDQYGNGIQMGDVDDGVMSTGGTIRDNIVHDIAQDGINVEEMISVTVQNNTIYAADSHDGAIYVRNVQDSTFTNNNVYNNDAIGVLIMSSSGITLTDNDIYNNADTNDTKYPGTAGIWIVEDSDASTIAIHDNNIYGNAEYGVRNLDTLHTTSATSNWWGDDSGPYHATLNPGGLGDAVSGLVDFDPWIGYSVGAPTATNDSYAADIGTTISVPAPGVLGNDTDPQSDPITAVLLTDVTYGDLTLNSDGSFVYLPDPDFSGTDIFTYQAFDGVHYSNTATVSLTERPPTTPTLISPDNGASVVGSSVTFQWSSVRGATDYKLIVSTSSNVMSTKSYKTNRMMGSGSITSFVDTGYAGTGTKYYWWVWAYAADGSYSPWAEVSARGRNFTSMPSVGTPTLVSPANAGEVIGTSVTFQWTAVTDAVNYRLLVSTSTSILDATKYKCNLLVGNVTTYLGTGYPGNGTKYYWWVWAYGADGTYSFSSQVVANGRNFTSMPSVGCPTLVSPANAAQVIGTSVTFQWNAVPDAVNYQLLVSTSTNIMDTTKYKRQVMTGSGSITSYVDTGYTGSGTKYYWYVWAYAADGSYSTWAQVSANGRNFTNLPSVGTPTLVSPANGASVSGTSVTFQWNAVTDAVNYKLVVSTSTNVMDTTKYKRQVMTGSGAITSYLDTGYTGSGTKYYWWVWAYAADGTYSLYSQVSANGRNFTNTA